MQLLLHLLLLWLLVLQPLCRESLLLQLMVLLLLFAAVAPSWLQVSDVHACQRTPFAIAINSVYFVIAFFSLAFLDL